MQYCDGGKSCGIITLTINSMKKLKMFKKVSSAVFLATMCLAGCNDTANNVHPSEDFTITQQHAIEKIASEYIINHPDILVKASKELQKKEFYRVDAQQREMVYANLSKIITPTTPTFIIDSKYKPKVKVIEFFDYQCAFCSKLSPTIEKLANDKNIELIFKETPIFGSQWPASLYAANIGNAIYKEFGGSSYFKFHNAIFGSNKDEGRLTKEDVNNAVQSAGVDINKLKITKSDSEQSLSVFGALGFTGTPMLIIMKAEPKSADDIKLIRGYSPQGISKAISDLEA